MLESRVFMLPYLSASIGLALVGISGLAAALHGAEPPFGAQGTEYGLGRNLLGDQTNPKVSLNREGGFIVWQDNAIDGQGLGIGAVALNNTLSPIPSRIFRVNSGMAADQEHPVVQVLPDGGAVFAWQGGVPGQQDIFARVLSAAGTFTSGDILINTFTSGQQADPGIALLGNGNLVIVWSSFGQDGSLQGVFGQVLAPGGAKIGTEFQANQYSSYNQRTPAVTKLATGGFVIAWVTEHQRFENSVDVAARFFTDAAEVDGNEFILNAGTNLCANPSVVAMPGGGVFAAWSERQLAEIVNGWDVAVGRFGRDGSRLGAPVILNQYRSGDQYAPRLALLPDALLAVWSSARQDSSREGVFGRYVTLEGAPLGSEFQINTTTISQQIHPAVASDGAERFLAVWSCFLGGAASFDIVGQRYALAFGLPKPAPPMVSSLDSYSLLVSWPPLAGFPNLSHYRLFVDDQATPQLVTSNYVIVGDLNPASTHSYRLAYEAAGGEASPVSEAGTGTTWGRDTRKRDGLPDDWQERFWTADTTRWPSAAVDSDGDGAANLDEFLAGTDPTRADSVLRVTVKPTTGGLLAEWSSLPGSVYQLQASADLKEWQDVGHAQFAAESISSRVIPAGGSAAYYRLIRVR